MHRELIEFWANATEDPFDVLFEQAPVLMHSIDADGYLVKVSRYWAELLGYRRSEMLGRKSTDFLTEGSRKRAIEDVLPSFKRTGKLHNMEYDFVTKSGEILPVRMSATSELDRNGNILRSLAILFDNRDAKAAEAARAAKVAEAAAANAVKSKFLAAMSH